MTTIQPFSKPLVVKIGGALLEQADQHAEAFAGLIALHRAHRDAGGGGIILVHGGGAQVDRQLKLVGIETPRIEGIRVTTREAIDQVVGVLAGSAHVRLLGILHAQGARVVGLGLSDGGLCSSARSPAATAPSRTHCSRRDSCPSSTRSASPPRASRSM